MQGPLLRILACPATPVLAGAALLFTIWSLPIGVPSSSAAGQTIARLLGEARGTICYPGSPDAFFIKNNGRLVAIPDGEVSHYMTTDVYVTRACLYNRTWQSGLWAPTTSTWALEVIIDSSDLTAADTAEVRRMFIDQLATTTPSLAAELPALQSGDVFHRTILWSGHLHNAASLASFLLFAISAPLSARRAWRALRTPPNHCPHCRYDLRATPPDAPCPECGRTGVR